MLEFRRVLLDRKSTRLNSSHTLISYAVFCLKKKKNVYETQYVTGVYEETTCYIRTHCQLYSALVRPACPYDRFACCAYCFFFFFFFNDTAPTEIYPLPLHDALPINDTATTEIYTLSLHDALRSRWSPYHFTISAASKPLRRCGAWAGSGALRVPARHARSRCVVSGSRACGGCCCAPSAPTADR